SSSECAGEPQRAAPPPAAVPEERAERTAAKEEERSSKASSAPQPSGGFVQDPFLSGVNCYAEVFLEVPDTTLSGIRIDPKAVTVYPTTRVYGGVSVQKEVLTGKYVIWEKKKLHHHKLSEVRPDFLDLRWPPPPWR
ncbi:unnamed protein product, partial [Prorocentrum cordatum]